MLTTTAPGHGRIVLSPAEHKTEVSKGSWIRMGSALRIPSSGKMGTANLALTLKDCTSWVPSITDNEVGVTVPS